MINHRIKSVFQTSAISLIVLAASLSITPTAKAVTGISLSDTIGDPNKITISPGSSFAVTMLLSATVEQLIGTTYSLVAPGAAAGKFTLVARDVVGTLFSDLTASNVSNTTLTNAATVDLGGLVANLATPTLPGTLFLADYMIASDPTLAPGVYLLQAGSNSVALDSAFNSLPVSTSSYEVTVVPEPGAAALAFVGLGVLTALRRARKARGN